jgi:hypothetical protein
MFHVRSACPVMQYRWVMFRIAGTGKEVVIEAAAEPSSNWDEFISLIPAHECRYGGTLPTGVLPRDPGWSTAKCFCIVGRLFPDCPSQQWKQLSNCRLPLRTICCLDAAQIVALCCVVTSWLAVTRACD